MRILVGAGERPFLLANFEAVVLGAARGDAERQHAVARAVAAVEILLLDAGHVVERQRRVGRGLARVAVGELGPGADLFVNGQLSVGVFGASRLCDQLLKVVMPLLRPSASARRTPRALSSAVKN